jgi:hypothetical protein
MMPKRYLSDGVYVDVDPRGLVLTTENGVSVTNEIVLDEDGVVELMRYLQDVQEIGEQTLQQQQRQQQKRRGGN